MINTKPEPPADIDLTVRRALEEDVGAGDITASLVPPGATATATLLSRESAVVCGAPWFERVFEILDPKVRIRWQVSEGESIEPDTLLCTLEGNARALLTGERTALNFLQTCSGTATAARRFANAIAGTSCRILDTRKTLPGLRAAQKYATACGGVTNHRMGLFDGVLIKENHLIACGGIRQAVETARASAPDLPVEVEVESLDECRDALDAGADILMLDNFSLPDMREAVALNRRRGDKAALLEASGNVELERLPEIAATGVDFISVGAITKHVRAIDLSMRFSISDLQQKNNINR
ncbi:MAG: carboxylating nicotinate-nucleotide diphosphorylase [Gammaproteobacteria bacterium]|jgi:nicotinate-nucleotide pyrophosphorylase (carboxylating)